MPGELESLELLRHTVQTFPPLPVLVQAEAVESALREEGREEENGLAWRLLLRLLMYK